MFVESRKELVSRNKDIKTMIAELPKTKGNYSAILKSSIIVMIYNMIEGIFTIILQECFDKMRQQDKIDNCPKNFLFIVADYYLKIIENNLKDLNKEHKAQKTKQPKISFDEYKSIIDNHKAMKDIKNNLNGLLNFDKNTKYIPQFVEYIDIFRLFSRNLDEDEIREIAKKFGVEFKGKKADNHLKLVKERRNRLAHGESKYSEECRQMFDSDIKNVQKTIFNYMSRVIKAFEKVYAN